MIRLLYDTTIAGMRMMKGAVLDLDPATEQTLVDGGSADRTVDFSDSPVLPTLVAQVNANGSWSRTSLNVAGDSTYQTLASVTKRVPMGRNSKLVIISDWDFPFPTTGSTKVCGIYINGATVGDPSVQTSASLKSLIEVVNQNSLTAQKVLNGNAYNVSSAQRLSPAINTAEDMVIDFKARWSAQQATTETITLIGYSIWHYPGT